MTTSAEQRLLDLAKEVKASFEQQRRVLSFDQYLAEVEARPKVLCRDAARYVKDMLDYYGQERVQGVRSPTALALWRWRAPSCMRIGTQLPSQATFSIRPAAAAQPAAGPIPQSAATRSSGT